MPHGLFEPLTTAPSRVARKVSGAIDSRPTESPTLAMIKGFLAGATEGAGDVVSDMTSPVSLASMAIPGVIALRRAAKAGEAANAARRAAMPRINARPDPINTIDVRIPTRTPKPIEGADITPEFNNAAEAFEHYWKNANPHRGTLKDVPDNPVARGLEAERRVIERRHSGMQVPRDKDRIPTIRNSNNERRRSNLRLVK